MVRLARTTVDSSSPGGTELLGMTAGGPARPALSPAFRRPRRDGSRCEPKPASRTSPRPSSPSATERRRRKARSPSFSRANVPHAEPFDQKWRPGARGELERARDRRLAEAGEREDGRPARHRAGVVVAALGLVEGAAPLRRRSAPRTSRMHRRPSASSPS